MFGSGDYFGFRGQKLNVAITVISGLDFALFGYDQGVMGGLLTLPSFVSTFPEIDTLRDTSNYTSTIQGISVSSYNLGCFLGAIVTIFIGDVLGRRRMIFLGSAIMIVGAVLQTCAFSLGQLIAGRVITGVGNGMNTSTVPTWASETSESHARGRMVMFQGAMITGGIALSYWLDFGLSFVEQNSVSWRFPIAFQILPAVLILMFILQLPESPRWLVLRNQEAEAKKVLSALADLPEDNEGVCKTFSMIKDQVAEAANSGYRDLFTMGPERNFHRVVLAYTIQVFQQISGINLITYYAATIFEKYIGLDGRTSRILAAANGSAYFIASFIAPFTIEKLGRRKSMLWGSVGMVASMVILAIMNYLSENSVGGSKPGVVSAVFLFVFNTFFAGGWLAVPWLYPAEIVPLKIRAPANGLSTSANWIFNFMVVMITPVAFNSIGYKTYIIFAVINFFMMPVILLFYPETAYRNLEEIDSIFLESKTWLGTVKAANRLQLQFGKRGDLSVGREKAFSLSQVNGAGGAGGTKEIGSGNGSVVHEENVASRSTSGENMA
ncbi:hypothetical protein SS1G_10413 [Sclerotinia sclerotiorum 1980 UF-70]|uniref:Major facilitator superfamily (MFS) profile domain-containing protein n=2 Tax=Sclerotinia sclerotiorum (strain ATCC 18683 / 1980 / Ss-1) TaxID=665079 RepID=A7EYJ7_SCLS1|nr:hypothetical protein SS1G_10413 [Sclerotinia sclerotiorum 1980 UF-70]APA16223.1 hypothetical protein sscle_16g109930 [Sclerotinia sclerotiorum 1980 UF-70]EDN94539.1 hypothetical protein SS1G_10413 [Sclerotinia sclerotiorum 1980 UF-70]